ncbi:MAG: MFS transporter [Candidatus Marinimicrobia bacterium]|nr:MFS transporter [Candidatus Neomarinimicrobiota bacterium]MBT3762817.1 MFS transporter [Candidatus Neomarinimicrobiota bacterium]MBT4068194.1 MFS transporter [Candidatus Neomarinimicrobiota bacterium]MBT4270673.1 MFS transporter [Candidatus Neomarinimicrobiota bacterium]MBT4371786.1 MFS transporter [Candidatus Neomarinimicrobiota bacterium]
MIPKKYVPVKEKIGYSLGDVASVLYWQTISLYLLYFYTDVFGITAAAAGTMILVARIWDGINDPLMGMLADRTKTKWGRFRPYLIWMSIPLAVIGVFTFSVPDYDYGGKLIYAYITYILLMTLYTAINIPYSSLLGVISPDRAERTSVSQFKYIGAYVGGLIISAALLPMTIYLGSGDEAQGWQTSMIIIGVMAIGLFFLTFASTNERVQPIQREPTSIKRDLKDLLANREWFVLLLATLFLYLVTSTGMVISTYYFKYYVGDQLINFPGIEGSFGFAELTSLFNSLAMIFSIIGVLCVKWFVDRYGKKKTFVLSLSVGAGTMLPYYFLTPESLWLIMVLKIISSFALGPISVILWAMYADTADFSEWKTGRRATGLVFSASTMSQKIAWALGTALSGWLLTSIGFEPNVEQSEQVIAGIKALMSTIPATAGLISIIMILFYKLDRKKMNNIEQELQVRRGAIDE